MSNELTDFGAPYNYFKGENLDHSLSTTEIARRIRQTIKERVKAGTLPKGKYSVRSQYFSGGSSIDIRVKDVDMLIWNPDRLIQEEIERKGQPWNWSEREIYTPWASELLNTLKGIMNSWNYDRSDSMTDYFDVNFYGHPEFDYTWADEQRKQAVAALLG